MGQEGVVLGHVVSSKGIEVGKAKLAVIEKIATTNFFKRCEEFSRTRRFLLAVY